MPFNAPTWVLGELQGEGGGGGRKKQEKENGGGGGGGGGGKKITRRCKCVVEKDESKNLV